jgi:fructose/tagatose bisphosphate aldolase
VAAAPYLLTKIENKRLLTKNPLSGAKGNPLGKRYSRQGFKTKASARAEMEKLRAQLITAEEESTPTVMAFSEVANDYLDFAKRRFVPKTYEKKVYVFKGFLKHAGDLPLNRVTVRAVESYLNTRSANTNYNRYRKELSTGPTQPGTRLQSPL